MPIESYIARFVTLKRQGKGLIGLCPFHNEKTPSFSVSPDHGRYRCFGCGRSGDLFQFAMEHEGLSFPEAVTTLARHAGVEVDQSRSKQSDPNRPLYELNELALRYYRNFFASGEGVRYRNYVAERGVAESSIDGFQIAAAPESWGFMTEAISGEIDHAIKLGLVRPSRNERGGNFDFFRNRIIFPIRDAAGRLIAFGGRTLSDDKREAKYLNSSESAIFRKSETLYGLYQALPSIRRSGEAILVEGYLDVIGLAAAGFPHAVAPLGTAVTATQLRTLQRYCSRFLLLFDGDSAGRNAALKSAELLLNEGGGVTAEVVFLPPGVDPFDLSRRFSNDQIEDFFSTARVSVESFLLASKLELPLFADVVGVSLEQEPLKWSQSIATRLRGRSFAQQLPIESRRRALAKLQQWCGQLASESDRRLFYEEGLRLLGLDAGQAAASATVSPVADAAAKRGSAHASHSSNRANRPTTPVSASGAGESYSRRTTKQPLSREEEQLRRLERELLRLLALDCGTAVERIEPVGQLAFNDEASELFWRYLENRLLRGDAWTRESLSLESLPHQVGHIFAPLVYVEPHKEEGVSASSVELVDELLLQHAILVLKRELSRLQRDLALADLVEQQQLIARQSELLRQLKGLEERRRAYHVPQASTEG